MPRGMMPRRPAKTGRHEGARLKAGLPIARPPKSNHVALPQKRAKDGPAAPPRGYKPTAPERISEILKRLHQLYPHVTCALTHKNAWELLVATLLSAPPTDGQGSLVTPESFRKDPTVPDLGRLEPEQLEAEIRSTGFFRNK